jgi:tetratricopeptide (TPR) repeat protein
MRLLAVALVVVLSGSSDNEQAMGMLKDWIKAADAHRAGESDAALAVITSWTYNDLEMIRTYVETLAGAPTIRNRDRVRRRSLISTVDLAAIRDLAQDLALRGEFDTFRKRAVILHTDAAIRGALPVVVPPPASRQLQARRARETDGRSVIVKSFDGRVENFELKNPHWDFAMDLLESLPGAPAPDPMIAEWYRAIGAYFAYERRFADALAHFDRAREAAPDDAGVLYEEACLHETFGAPRIQNYVRVTTLPNGFYIRGVDSAPTEWRRAEGLLRRALSLDPKLTEARLRLARVLTQQKKFDEGLGLAEQVVAESRHDTIRYYGHLIAGDAQLSLDRAAAARDSYLKAIDLFPDSQAARLGLGAALRVMGQSAEALEAMMPTLTKQPSTRPGDDPWWEYYGGDASQVDALLADLRAPFKEPRQ